MWKLRWLAVSVTLGCGQDGATGQTNGYTTNAGPQSEASTEMSTTGSSMNTSSATNVVETGFEEPDGPWEPGIVFPSTDEPNPRGFYDIRGLVHTHSPYSYDACDGEPLDKKGHPDAVCMQDLRRAICQTRHDFIMLTDHREAFADFEYPEVLLHDPERGDSLVEHAGMPTANWAGCPAVDPVLIMAGCESAMMPVGLEAHVPGRHKVYGEASVETKQIYDQHGALTLVAHTEGWAAHQILELGLDGFEMYNLHANLIANPLAGGELIALLENGGEGLPHSDLLIYPIFQEVDKYLSTWGTVLSTGTRAVTTMGSDAHRNAFPQELPDGERIDSFRRMMMWFSNHVLIDKEGWNDRDVKDAMRAGRLYGVFEYLGYADGFDAYAESASGTVEIGGQVALADSPEIHALAPTVQRVDPDVTPPEITLHLLRAIDGGFDQVASGTTMLHYIVEEPGAYRVEVRMAPLHIKSYLGNYKGTAGQPRVWIYANPFYVVE